MARIEQSIEVNVPLHTAYNQWTQFEEFPRFMEGVREVRQLDDAHLHWLAERHGRQVEWDSEITEQVPDRKIEWRDVSGPRHEGSISFEPVEPDRTRVRMIMDFDLTAPPPASFDAEREVTLRVEQDLARFKQMLEAQHTESGAWRGEIHHGRTMGAGAIDPADATASAAGKSVGQTADERREAGATGTAGTTGEAMSSAHAAHMLDEQARSAAHAGATASSAAYSSGAGVGVGVGSAPGVGSGPAEATGAGAGQARAGAEHERRAGGPQSWLPNLLQRWDEPMVMVRKMTEEMDQLFERFIGRPMASRIGQGGMAGKWMPPVEVSQRGGDLVICADLPGVRREDVHIEVLSNKLTVEGERHEEGVHMTPQGYRRSERSYGRFYRMIPLPDGIDPDSVRASMRDGVLEIVVPVPPSEQRRGKRVDIQPPDGASQH